MKTNKCPRVYMLLIVACLAGSLFCLAYPFYVIRPFRAQGVRELAAALLVFRFRPFVMGLCVIFAVTATVRYWSLQPRRWLRLAAVTGAVVVCVFAALSRVNIYERMFYPMGAPAIESAADAQLDKDEKVLAIQLNGVARAYPIRGIAYHHVANDVVGGVPIAATY
jgi:hypothetical protein